MDQLDNYLDQFDPYRDSNGRVSEEPSSYAKRMQSGPLPQWPEELLLEWLYRHAGHVEQYAFLGFERLHFRKEIWPVTAIPGRKAFLDPTFFDSFTNIERRAEEPYDCLAKYMLEHGTWNTPIVLLENPRSDIVSPNGWPLRSPYHLLEGHRRLSFLNGLRHSGKAQEMHTVSLATVE